MFSGFSLAFVGLLGFLAVPGQSIGSCREAKMCCDGRDSSCVVQKAPINAIIEDLSDQPCYCDHACLRLGDCCTDFKETCGVTDCEVADWGEWSQCDEDCGPGSMVRTRSVIKEAHNGGKHCPDLTQRRGCYGTKCEDHHFKSSRETAMILPASFSKTRTVNATKDIRNNLRLRYPKDPAKEESREYCVQFEVTKSSKACHVAKDASRRLVQGETVCVRCEDAAMRRHLGYICTGHGDEHRPTRYLSMSNQHCHGRWLRKKVSDNCACAGGDADFIFV